MHLQPIIQNYISHFWLNFFWLIYSFISDNVHIFLAFYIFTQSVSNDDPNTQYGVAVAIHENDSLGTTYGHSGWIPGYCSSLRYYSEYGVAIAFQINTDIGIVDGSTQVFKDMENNLAKVVIEQEKIEAQ